MKQRPPVRRVERLRNPYIALVCAGGIGLLIPLAPAGIRAVWHTPLALGLTAVGVVLGEFARIDVQWRGKTFHYTMASPFTLAILALWGLPAALLAAAAATLLDDRVNRSTLPKTLFNLGQASLALGAAGLVYALLADGPVTSWRQAPAFCAAAVLNLAVSELAVRAAVTLDRQAPSAGHLLEHTRLYALTVVLNAGLTLAVLLAVGDRWLVPVMLGAPVLAVHQACRIATRERAARARAEASQLEAEGARTVAEKAQAEAEAARADAERGRAEAERQAAARAHLLGLARGLVGRLRAQERHKNETMALVAHELREPLGMIASIAASLRNRDQRVGPAARQELLAAVLQHAECASDAARRLRLDARHHRTQPTVEPAMTMVDAAELLRHVGQLAAFIHHDRPIEVHAPGPLTVRLRGRDRPGPDPAAGECGGLHAGSVADPAGGGATPPRRGAGGARPRTGDPRCRSRPDLRPVHPPPPRGGPRPRPVRGPLAGPRAPAFRS